MKKFSMCICVSVCLYVCKNERSNQSILREINPENSLEGLRLKLKLPYWSSDGKKLTHWESP